MIKTFEERCWQVYRDAFEFSRPGRRALAGSKPRSNTLSPYIETAVKFLGGHRQLALLCEVVGLR
jgi:hypothetical protein